MIIVMRSEGQDLEHNIRQECIDWLTKKEFEVLTSMSDKDFYQWVREDMEERFENYDTSTLEQIIKLMKGEDND